jgi:hypothetical protein
VLHDIGQQDGTDYLVMECVEGGTLAKRLEKGPLPLEQVLKLVGAGTGWAQHLSALPHHQARDGGSSGGLATHLVGTREIACVLGVQKTPEAARMALAMGRENGSWLYAARPPAGSGGGLKWQTWQTFAIPKSRLSCLESGGREGIRTHDLLIANGESLKLRRFATIS